MPPNFKNFEDQKSYSRAVRRVYAQRMENLTQRMIDEEIDMITWQIEMKDLLRESYKLQFIAGKGGDASQIFIGDYGAMGQPLSKQYEYLNAFARAVREAADAGKDVQFAVKRAGMYGLSSQQVFWKAAIPAELSQVPGDGKTQCKTHCQCTLKFEYVENDQGKRTEVHIWWELGSADHCEDCISLSKKWSPLKIKL